MLSEPMEIVRADLQHKRNVLWYKPIDLEQMPSEMLDLTEGINLIDQMQKDSVMRAVLRLWKSTQK